MGAIIYKAKVNDRIYYFIGDPVTNFDPHLVGANNSYDGSQPTLVARGVEVSGRWHTHPTNPLPGFSARGDTFYKNGEIDGDLGGYVNSRVNGYVSIPLAGTLLKFQADKYFDSEDFSMRRSDRMTLELYVCVAKDDLQTYSGGC
jgi:hypothetical protein